MTAPCAGPARIAPSSELDVGRNLYAAVEAARDTGHEGFALLLDEAQVIRDDRGRGGEHPMSMLVAAANALQEAGLPLALVLCGLPTLRPNLPPARPSPARLFRGEGAEAQGLIDRRAREPGRARADRDGSSPGQNLADPHHAVAAPPQIGDQRVDLGQQCRGVGCPGAQDELNLRRQLSRRT